MRARTPFARAGFALARSAAVLAAFAWVLAVGVMPAQAGPNGGVGYRVDGEPGSVIDGGFLVMHVAPGGTATGHFFATNTGMVDAQLAVYAADGVTGDTSGIVYRGANEQRRDAGRWLTPSTRGLLLRADDARRVDVAVRVPAAATPGDHVGGIVLEQQREQGPITQVVRNVVPVLVDVAGAAERSLELRSALVTELPGTALPAVTIKLRNDGRRICRPTLSASLTGPGERGAPVIRSLDAILPGDSVPYPLPWPRDLQRGTFAASVTASGCGAPTSLRTDVRSDVTAEASVPKPTSPVDEVVTSAPPTQARFTPPQTPAPGAGDGAAESARSAARPPAMARGELPGGPPLGASGTAAGGTGDGGGITARFPGLGELGDVAIEYLPPLLQRLVAPLSLLLLMLLFLLAQEAFDRKDPKLALAPIVRDPDLEFRPLGDGDGPSPTPDLVVLATAQTSPPA